MAGEVKDIVTDDETKVAAPEDETVPTEDGETESEETNPDVNDEAEDVLTVQIGDDAEVDEAPEWVKELRRANREKDRELRELRAKLQTNDRPALRPKPTDKDHDYDGEAFAADLEKWFEEKRQYEEEISNSRKLAEQQEQRWTQKLSAYEEGKVKIGAKDYDEAESTVMQLLDKPFPGIAAPDVRLNIIKQGAKDPAMIVYALGRNPKKAAELAAIDDPVEFAFAIGEMSGKMKVVRGKAPPPERKMGASVPGVSGATDNALERLREEAAKTGDYSKVLAYKRQKR